MKKNHDFYTLIENDQKRRFVGRNFSAKDHGLPIINLWNSTEAQQIIIEVEERAGKFYVVGFHRNGDEWNNLFEIPFD